MDSTKEAKNTDMEKPIESDEKPSDVLVQETRLNEADDDSEKVEENVQDDVQADSNESTQEKTGDEEIGTDNGKQTTKQSDNPELDPYAYLQGDSFTSELFKVELQSLPKYCGIKQLKKKLASLNLQPVKTKVVDKGGYAFVTFKNEEDREACITALDGHEWKNKKVRAKRAKAVADPLIQKRKMEAESEGSEAKKAKEDNRSVEERLNDSVTPLWKVPYEEQLKTKEDNMKQYLRDLAKLMHRENKFLAKFINEQRKENDGMCCKMCGIKRSPQEKYYRNKSEFTIGQSPDKTDKTIGFRLGSYKSGLVGVVEPTSCLHIPDKAKHVLQDVQRFCQDTSTLSGLNPETRTGNWTMVTMRTSDNNDVMVVMHMTAQNIEKDTIEEEKNNMVDFFKDHISLKKITSLYLEVQQPNSKEDSCMDHLLGATHLHENLLGLKFRISPAAFFQVNTGAAEVLYSTVADLAGVTEKSVVLDVCCGTGTIGLTLAKRVKQVIGIEMCKEALQDARANAELNGIENTQFYCSKAEDILPKLIGRYRNEDVVAIVDPPRAGLHPDVVRAIRKSEFVKRLVYVSCQPTAAKPNIVDLTRAESKRMQGPEFKMVEAVPVDLFPLTPHCELVMLLTR